MSQAIGCNSSNASRKKNLEKDTNLSQIGTPNLLNKKDGRALFHGGIGHIHDNDSGPPRNDEDKVNSKQMIHAMLSYVWPKVGFTYYRNFSDLC